MSEKALRNIFVLGTLFFMLVLIVMTVDSLSAVESARTPPLDEQVVTGKRVWQARNCNDCHTILGIGGYFAPEMTKVAERRDAEWLRAFMTDPQAAKPGTTMPNQHLLSGEADNLVAFLQWVAQVDTNDWPPRPRIALGGGGEVLTGAQLFQQKNCTGCHRVSGLGATGPGPDLSQVGSRYAPETLAQWIEDPQAAKPGTNMPRVPMSSSEREMLVQYLASLR